MKRVFWYTTKRSYLAKGEGKKTVRKTIVIMAMVAAISVARGSELWWQLGADEGASASCEVMRPYTDAAGKIETGWLATISPEAVWSGGSEEKVGKATASAVAFFEEMRGASSRGMIVPYTFVRVASDSAPEPTSGLLMLVGVAALALRRRKGME